MSRSGFFLSLSGPAAILTLMIHPSIRDAADNRLPTVAAQVQPVATRKGTNDVVVPVHYASIPNAPSRVTVAPPSASRTASEKEMPRVRKPLQEGCERSISSLAGPEARRMMPGRCMT